jgi:sugar lactone lactonase YvrE
MTEIRLVFDGRHELGEGCVWNAADGRLWWVDIKAPTLHALDPASGAHEQWSMPGPIGSFAFRRDGGLLVAVRTGLAIFHPESGVFEPLLDLEPEKPDNRLNDGRCDRQGRFWVGTMSMAEREPSGTLWRFGEDRRPLPWRRGIVIPNSIAFAPDGRTMYFTDTAEGRILAFDYDPATGEPVNERTFAALDTAPGRPDGSTVDAEGFLWNARYGGSCVVRYAPDGRVDRVVKLPVSQPTCCGFGGPDLRTLFITSAAQFLAPDQRAREPKAGSLFGFEPGVQGLPEPLFAG